MADATILAAGSEALPAGYTVPAQQVIQPKMVRAVVDGTGASGSFVAVCQIVSDSGIIIAEGVCSSTVAAGGSAQVSWFPGGGLGIEAASGLAPWAMLQRGLAVSCPGTTVTKIVPDASSFYTNAPSVFDVATVVGGDVGIRFLALGHFGTMAWGRQNGIIGAATYGIEIYQDGASGIRGNALNPYLTTSAGMTQDETTVSHQRYVQVTSATITPPTPIQIWEVNNVGASAITFQLGAIVAWQLDADDVTIS